MTCFFDPSHQPGSMNVMWSPQWGVPRPVQACPQCAQRVQSAPPPYYLPQGAPQPGYPQPGYAAPGYPQPGYAAPAPGYAQPGYAQPGYAQPGYAAPVPGGYPRPKSGHSTGAMVGVGLAGLAGGALIGEMMSDDSGPGIIESVGDTVGETVGDVVEGVEDFFDF